MSNSLFTNGQAGWEADPLIAFDAWLVNARIGESSSKVYRVLWARYVEWARLRQLGIASISQDKIEAFLDSLQVKRQQRERSHRLIERVLDDIHSREPGSTNAARMAKKLRGMGWRDADSNDPTGFLGEHLRQAIIEHGNAWQFDAGSDPAQSAVAADKETWRLARNRAMMGVFLGGGLKVAEVRGLTVNCVKFEHGPWIRARPARQPMRQVRLAPYAVRWLQEWSGIRQAAGTLGTWLFPGDASGKPISVATISRLVHAYMAGAAPDNVLALAVTAQTLRNDRVAQLLQEQAPHAEIAERIGYADEISVARMEVAWEAWQRENV